MSQMTTLSRANERVETMSRSHIFQTNRRLGNGLHAGIKR